MPVLIVNGVAHGPYDKPGSAGPCEWCGLMLVAFHPAAAGEYARSAVHIPDDAPVPEVGKSLQYCISARLCRACDGLFRKMARDQATERVRFVRGESGGWVEVDHDDGDPNLCLT